MRSDILQEQVQYYRDRAYRVVKIFHEPTQLQAALQSLGWTGDIDRTDNYFLQGLFAPEIAPSHP